MALRVDKKYLDLWLTLSRNLVLLEPEQVQFNNLVLKMEEEEELFYFLYNLICLLTKMNPKMTSSTTTTWSSGLRRVHAMGGKKQTVTSNQPMVKEKIYYCEKQNFS